MKRFFSIKANSKRALLVLSLLLSMQTAYNFAEPSLLGGQSNRLVVNNRILAKVNGKAISVIDVMKKMDILFYREFPQYVSSEQARFQFYEANWEHLLNELIDKELILADAAESQLPMTSGDVRQEMEAMFGPNIIGNLDKIGMNFDEAWKIIEGDLILQRMLYVRVNSKALRSVTPLAVWNLYKEYAPNNMRMNEWVYQVITIRDKDQEAGAATANIAYQYLNENSIALAELTDKIKEHSTVGKTSKITISEEYRHSEKELSPANKEVLEKLLESKSKGKYSLPTAQKSRSDNSMAFRIFFLKEMIPGGAPSYQEVANQLRDQLLQKAVVAESEAYIQKLRRHFDVHQMVPEKFKPFSL